jgi:hypothetical protein
MVDLEARTGVNRELVITTQFEREQAKLERMQKMQENLNSTFQKDLTKFQEELKKRKDKLKKFDDFMSQRREENGFRFIKYYKKRENTKQNIQ